MSRERSVDPVMGHVAAALAVVVSLVGCAGRFAQCPANGGPSWRELVTAHFSLRTDLDPEDARRVIHRLELLRAALLTVFRARTDLETGRIPVIALRRGWGEIAPANVGGFFAEALFRPLIVLQANGDPGDEAMIKHELVHYLTLKVWPVQPRWFGEGLATYFESIEYDVEARLVTVGKPSEAWVHAVTSNPVMPIDEMMAATQGPHDGRGMFYPTAWLTMHYLMNRHPRELVKYEKALQTNISSSRAWTESFPTLPTEELGPALRGYLESGQYKLLLFPFDPPSAPAIEERGLADADVHATRGLLLAMARDRPTPTSNEWDAEDLDGRARGELQEALRLEPAHLLAQAVNHWMLGAGIDPVKARAVTDRHPDEWLAWLLLAESLASTSSDESVAAARKAVDLAGGDRAATLNVSFRRKLPPTAAPH